MKNKKIRCERREDIQAKKKTYLPPKLIYRTYLKKLTDVSDFPKWLLALAGTNLIPILLCPFLLFGGLQPFGQSEVWILNFLLYLLSNLLWVAPLLLFFVGLQLYRRCFEVPGIIVNAIGALLTIVDIWLLCI